MHQLTFITEDVALQIHFLRFDLSREIDQSLVLKILSFQNYVANSFQLFCFYMVFLAHFEAECNCFMLNHFVYCHFNNLFNL